MARGESLHRQWTLLQMLQSFRFGVSTDDLSERLGCDKRTIQRDLKVLQEMFPVQSNVREFGKKFWSIEPKYIESGGFTLSTTEMISLYLSQQLLLPLTGTQFGDGLASVLEKIRTHVPSEALHHFRELDGAFLIKNLANYDYSRQGDDIALLNEAVLHQREVRITYHSASQKMDLTSAFHPYGMVLLYSSLYCIGYLTEYDEVRTLKVARIRKVEETDHTFEKPATFSLLAHTHGAFGVFGPGTLQTIRVRFSNWAATNVREHEWHPSQKIVTDDGDTVEAEFELSSTVEFKRWLLGFGRHALVRKPASLAREIAADLRDAAAAYESD